MLASSGADYFSLTAGQDRARSAGTNIDSQHVIHGFPCLMTASERDSLADAQPTLTNSGRPSNPRVSSTVSVPVQITHWRNHAQQTHGDTQYIYAFDRTRFVFCITRPKCSDGSP